MTDQEVKEIKKKIEDENYEWHDEELKREDFFGFITFNVCKKVMGEYLDFRNSSHAMTLKNTVNKNNSRKVKECVARECANSKIDLNSVDGRKLRKAILYCMSYPDKSLGDDYYMGLMIGRGINLF